MQSDHAMVISKKLLLTLIWDFANLLCQLSQVSDCPSQIQQAADQSK